MATFNKFQIFVQDVGRKVHDLNADTLKIMLTNTAPNTADTHFDTVVGPPAVIEATSNAAEITAQFGYAAGGATVPATRSFTQTAGVGKLLGGDVVFTAAGGSIGPFRYAVLYNATGGAGATRPVIGWWDYGSALTLLDTETLTVDLDQAAGILTIGT